MKTRVLLVEDSATQREALLVALEEGGYEVIPASNGDEALRVLDTEEVDLVVSDVLMPGEVDGYEMCRRVKQSVHGDTPVMLLTSLSDPMDIIRGLEAGADNFLTKPCPTDQLLERIGSLLSTRERRTESRVRAGVSVYLMGSEFDVTAEREQILDLLITTFEDAVRQNKQLRRREDELSRSREILSGLYDISVGLNECSTEQDVAETALERALRLPGVRAGWIYLKDEEGEHLQLVAERNLPSALTAPGALEGDCLCRRALLSGEMEDATIIRECECILSATGDLQGIRHHASVPLHGGDRACGIMNLLGEGPGSLTDEDLPVLYGVGTQIAFSIERARLLAGLEGLVEKRTVALQAEIEEKTRAQESLRLSDSILRALHNLVLVSDGEGRIHWASPSVRNVLGFEPEEVTGEGWWDLTCPDAQERTRLREQAAGEARGEVPTISHPYEVAIRARDGTARWILWTHSRGPDGLLIRVGYDVTERKSLEDQFHEAQKMEAVGRLAGGVAHDFNNVLTAILGTADLLLMDSEEGSSTHTNISEVRRAAERAARLTRQLLVFARRQLSQPRVLNLNEIIRDVEGMLRSVLRDDIVLTMDLAPDLGNARVDPGQADQVLMNLVVNASDAMPDGGIVTIATRNVEFDHASAELHIEGVSGGGVIVEVTDTGIGIDDEVKAHIFEPFFSTKELDKGTGLGLATVHGIVRQSGGRIAVHSTPGEGTSFKILLPRVEAPVDPIATPVPDASPAEVTETVLVAENDDSVRSVTIRILQRAGYTVLEAENGDEALAVAEAHPGTIHLLLSDVVMPGLNARELARKFNTMRPDAEVLFMSGYTDGAIGQTGLLERGFGFIEKPFGPRDLLQRVREVLHRQAD